MRDGIDRDPVELKDTELELAHQLVAKLSGQRFDPSRYEDGYRSAVLAAVETKLEGQEVAPRCAQPEEPILDKHAPANGARPCATPRNQQGLVAL